MSSASASPSKPEGQTIDLASLTTPHLSQIKSQLSSDLNTLTTSYTSLRSAQAKFRDCISALDKGVGGGGAAGEGKGKEVLVPLTGSLYVPGRLVASSSSSEEEEEEGTAKVVVDVGTGFFVEKTPDQARHFYKQKVEELGKNLLDLEAIVQGKQGTLRVVEDVLRQKVLQEQTSGKGAVEA